MPSELLTVLFHESGHAVRARSMGHRQRKFELERLEKLFGDAEPDSQTVKDDSDFVAIYFVGPLAEIRFLGNGEKIDCDRSLAALCNARSSEPLEIYFGSNDEPSRMPCDTKSGLATDWNMIDQLYRDVAERDPGFDCKQHYLEMLQEAIEFVNSDTNWRRIQSLATEMAMKDEFITIRYGQIVDLVEEANRMLDKIFFRDERGLLDETP